MVNLKIFLILLLSFMLFLSCEGPQGPEGAMGPQGEQGEDGDNGYPGPQGPPGDPAPVPEFAGYYATTNLEDIYFLYLGIDQFFAVFREPHDDPGGTFLICEGHFSWTSEGSGQAWIYFRSDIYDIRGSGQSYVYAFYWNTLKQSLGEPLFNEGEGEENIEIDEVEL